MENRPLSEIWKEAADDWVDKDAAARLLEDTKTLRMAQHQAALGEMSVAKAEQIIKASPAWYNEVVKIVESRTEANKAKVYMDSIKMRFSEQMNEEANHRAEARL